MFAVTLEELGGQLAVLQPKQAERGGSGKGGSSSGGGHPGEGPSDLMQRLLERAPSDQLRAYAEGHGRAQSLQRGLPEQLDQNLHLLGVLAAEMRAFARQLERLAAAAVGEAMRVEGGDGDASGGDAAAGGDDALLLAALADSAAQETQLVVSCPASAAQGPQLVAGMPAW